MDAKIDFLKGKLKLEENINQHQGFEAKGKKTYGLLVK